MPTPRLPSSFGTIGPRLSTKGYSQPGTGDTHYICNDSEAYGQVAPTESNPVGNHHQMAEAGVPGPGGLPYIPGSK